MDEKHPGGAPSKYEPEYCEKVIEFGKAGYSIVEMAAEIGVCRATLEANWPAEHREFLEAFTRAKMLSQAWWEGKGRTNLNETSFQSSLYARSMAARFPRDWRESKRTELTGKDGGPIESASKIDMAKLTEEQLRALSSIKLDNA